MRVLFLGSNDLKKYNKGHQLFKNKIGKYWNVLFYGQDHIHNGTNKVPDIVNKYGPFDLIMTYHYKRCGCYEGMREVDIKKVHFVMDYVPKIEGIDQAVNYDQIRLSEIVFRKHEYDLFFALNVDAKKRMIENGFNNIFVLPFCVDIDWFVPGANSKSIDIIFPATRWLSLYERRESIKIYLDSMGKYKVNTRKFTGQSYINTLGTAKILVNSLNRWNTLNYKILEGMSCGAMLLTEPPFDLDLSEIKDGEHLVLFEGIEDMRKKIDYYLKNDSEREKIAKAGQKFVRENHNTDVRAKQMIEIVERELFNG